MSGQDNVNPVKIIETIIRLQQDTAKIFYFDSVATSYRVNAIKTNLAKRTIKSIWKDSLANNSITLSKAERKFIFKQLDSLHKIVWDTNLFANSIRVSYGLGWGANILKEFNEFKWNIKSGRQIWGFTSPIFIRDNSICLLHILYLCGGTCGHDELCFYKNINGSWKKWIRVTAGDF